MNTVFRCLIATALLFTIASCSTSGGSENTMVLIKTTSGDIKVKLYDGTPLHRDNFIKLVNMGFYDGISFHRVISDFMIQAGEPSTRTGLTKEQLDTLDTYTIPAEFRREYYHRKGALAAAREGNNVNPAMSSSGTQFYIVQGKKYTAEELKTTEERLNSGLKQVVFSKFIKETADSAQIAGTPLSESEIQERASMKMFNYLTTQGEYKFSQEQIDAYMNIGGVPRLDATYTVFGEVVEGLEIVDKIAGSPTNQADKPVNDIRIISMKVVGR
ncbi:MAG: peptidylprolyl isomerase [Bacteroidales bacterium]|jgi:cyclophilin family peptidyl-prolyl cis-trans isomerase|nr:peptidylprolyl isomerase [Bacteroidales bacterium]